MARPQAWVLIPTAARDHVPHQLEKWRERGYRVGVLTDGGTFFGQWGIENNCDMHLHLGLYPGVWRSWNILAKAAMALGADVAVLAGDDMDPDPKYLADEIADQYLVRFPDGDGVMQPCGDPQGGGAAERICGSPWVGRQWVHGSYMGNGPVCDEYVAFYADEELKLLTERLGRLWMRPDLTQYHKHWSWGHQPRQFYHERNQASWLADKALFEKRNKEVKHGNS